MAGKTSKKVSLSQQFDIEDKRRRIQTQNEKFDIKKPFTEQMKALLPNIVWKIKQALWLNALQFIKWYLGGYKSGKTFSGVCLDIFLAWVNNPFPGILVHPTADGIEITIIPLIEEICELNKIEFEIKKLSTKWIVYFKFGLKKKDWGKLILASGDKPKSLKGPKLAWGHIDEPLIMGEEIVSVIMSRLAEARGLFHQLFFTGTPEPLHMKWGFDVVDKKEENTANRFITTVSAREIKEFLPPNYIENQEANLSPEMVQTFVDGEYRNLSQGRVYENFTKDNIYDPLTDLPKRNITDNMERNLGLSYDFNVKQMSGSLWDFAGRYKLQVEEYRIQSKSNTRQLTRMIINQLEMEGYLGEADADGWRYTKYGNSLIITGDATGQSGSSKSNLSDYEQIIEEFERAKINIDIFIPEANPAVRDRTNYMNTEFELGFALISKKCPLSIRDRELTSWVLGSKGFVIDKTKAEISHLADSGDYACWNTQALTDVGGDENSGSGSVKTVQRQSR